MKAELGAAIVIWLVCMVFAAFGGFLLWSFWNIIPFFPPLEFPLAWFMVTSFGLWLLIFLIGGKPIWRD